MLILRRCLIDGEIVLRASSIRSFDKCDKVSLIKELSSSGRLKCPFCGFEVVFKYSSKGLFKPHFSHMPNVGSCDCPYFSDKLQKPKPDNLVISDSSCSCGSFEFLDTDLGILCRKCLTAK